MMKIKWINSLNTGSEPNTEYRPLYTMMSHFAVAGRITLMGRFSAHFRYLLHFRNLVLLPYQILDFTLVIRLHSSQGVKLDILCLPVRTPLRIKTDFSYVQKKGRKCADMLSSIWVSPQKLGK